MSIANPAATITRVDELRTAADLLASAKRVVVFTGAGVSAESGVPTAWG